MSSNSVPEPARPPWSLAARLTAWYAVSAFVLIFLATLFLYWAMVSNLDREDDEFLADKVHRLRLLLRDRPKDSAALHQEVAWEATARQLGQVYVRVLDHAGHTILETPGMSVRLPLAVFPTPLPAEAEPGTATELELAGGEAFRVLAAQAVAGQGSPWVIQAAFDRTYEENLFASYRRRLWLVLAVALLVCTVTGYQIARRGLRPLQAIGETARRIRSSTLHERIAAPGLPAELAILAGTFNDMLDRLEDSFQRLAQFSADIAHELRNPVNNLRGEAEVALGKPRSVEEYREVLSSCLEECGRLARLIDTLLFLARAESPRTQIAREWVEVDQELRVVRDFYEAAAAEAGVALSVDAAPDTRAELDRTLFQRAVGNLVANALAHTSAGGRVSMTARPKDGQLCVEVADTGCGIPPEHLPHVFDRFYRVDAARTAGSGRVGLGLSLVRSIAALHRGNATITSVVGEGTLVRLLFPRAAGPNEGRRAETAP